MPVPSTPPNVVCILLSVVELELVVCVPINDQRHIIEFAG
jgi:hypothetical protein